MRTSTRSSKLKSFLEIRPKTSSTALHQVKTIKNLKNKAKYTHRILPVTPSLTLSLGLDPPILKNLPIKKKSYDGPSVVSSQKKEAQAQAQAHAQAQSQTQTTIQAKPTTPVPTPESPIPAKPAQSTTEKKKLVILKESKKKLTGRLKFFNKEFGFIVNDANGKDIFVHYVDLNKAGLRIEDLNNTKLTRTLRFSFTALTYIGKNNTRQQKAIDLEIMN